MFAPKTQAGRDLYWALTSPMMLFDPLMVDEDWGRRELERFEGLFRRLDAPGSALHKRLKRAKTRRLGEYFELLLAAWIEAVPEAHCLATNWQVNGAQGTIGEYDLLFQRDNVTWHWELAVKFYLEYQDFRGKTRWLGPNPKDRLGTKWEKMRHHQLNLSRTPEGRQALKSLHVSQKVHPRAFLKGYLFRALDEEYGGALPRAANPEGLRGWWCHLPRLKSHRESLDPQGTRRFLPLSRLRWMSPALVGPDDRPLGFDALLARLAEHPRSYALIAVLEEESPGLVEVSRGFVVSDKWP